MIFRCEKCGKQFDHKSHYNLHLRRKTPCKNENIENNNIVQIERNDNVDPININVDPINIDVESIHKELIVRKNNDIDINFTNNKVNGFKCLICNKIYKYSQSLYVHKKNAHTNYKKELKQLINKNYKQIIKEDKLVQPLIQNNNNGLVNNGTVNNNDNKIINNIIIGFGKEDISKLTDDDKYHILNERGINPIESLIEWSHFNSKIPEQRNIKYPNLHSKYAEIHDGTHWFKQLTNIVVNELLDNHTDNLNQLVKKYNKNYKIKKSVTNILDQFSDFCSNENIDNDELRNMTNNEKKQIKDIKEFITQTKEEIKLFIHNKTLDLKNKGLLQ